MLFILTSLYSDSEAIQEHLKSTHLNELINLYIKHGSNVKMCKARNEFLLKFFKIRVESSVKILDCKCDIDFILSNILSPSICSGEILLAKCECSNKKNKPIPFFNLSNMKSSEFLINCNDCMKSTIIHSDQIQFNDYIFVKTNENNIEREMGWKDFPRAIMFNSIVYALYAIVECIHAKDSNGLDHFKCHILRNTQWYTYDHTQNRLLPASKKKSQKIIPHLYVFSIYKLVCGITDIENDAGSSTIVHLRNFLQNEKDGVTTFVQNSCGPDSLFQSLACLYVENVLFKELCELRKREHACILIDLIQSFTSNNIANTHSIRNDLLGKHFQSIISNGLITINCESNMYNNINNFISPVFPSIIQKKTCGCGPITKKFPIIEIDHAKLNNLGIQNLESCIVQQFTSEKTNLSTCKVCNEQKMELNHIGNLIFIDVQAIEHPDKSKIGLTCPISINQIPENIILNEYTYELMSVIQYISGSLGHYIAHCKQNGIWYAFDDTKQSPTLSYGNILPHTLIYFITKK